MFETLLYKQYGLPLKGTRKFRAGTGSDTWFLSCTEGKFVLKFPSGSEINHPELEPELCTYLRENGVPACNFIKNADGSFISEADDGQIFTVQRRLPGTTPEWNTASEELLTESALMLGKIHLVLENYPPLPEGIGAGFFGNVTI